MHIFAPNGAYCYIYFCICSRETLNETFTATNGLHMMALSSEHAKWDQNPTFTPLSKTTSIPTPFICKSPLLRVKSLALTFICKSPLPPVEKSCSHLNKSFCLFDFEIWMYCCLLINTVNLFDAADLPYLRTEIIGVNWLYNILISKKQDILKFSSSYNERCLRNVTSNNNIVDSGCGDAGPGNER